MRRLDRQPLFVAAFLAVLFLPQAAAFALQIAGGYRPFVTAPGRVPLSWDMFAIRIVRCDVTWEPPLLIGEQRVAAMREAGWPLEWDVTYDTIGAYRHEALRGCNFAVAPTTAHLLCFTHDGRTETADVACPAR
jgi:hypothetical protein